MVPSSDAQGSGVGRGLEGGGGGVTDGDAWC